MLKFRHVWLEVLTENVYYIFCTYEQYVKAVRKQFNLQAPSNDTGSIGKFGVYHKNGQNISVIWIDSERSNIGTIVHEVIHAVHYIMQKKGMWLHDSSEEIYAYTIQYIVKEILGKKRNESL